MKYVMAALAALLMISTAASAELPRTKILLIGHAHDHAPGTHMYLEVCEVLAHCLRQTPRVETVVSDGWPDDASVLEGVDSIVLHTGPGGNILLSDANREQAEKMLENGVGLVAIHWATDAHPDLAPRYMESLGGWFNTMFASHETTTAVLTQKDPAHPISRGWSNFELHDEYYVNTRLSEEAHPVLEVDLPQGGNQVVGWVLERPHENDGRSFGTTLGHFYDNMKLEPFRKLLVNGILWTAGRHIPLQGAPCRTSDVQIDTFAD